MDVNQTPRTLRECFEYLDANLQDKEAFKNCPADDVVAVSHHTLGRWLRNKWHLWWSEESRDKIEQSNRSKLPMEKVDYPQEMPKLVSFFRCQGINHPDDMTGIIIRSYHRKINGWAMLLKEQIEDTRKFYEENK